MHHQNSYQGHQMKNLCEQYQNYYVVGELTNGEKIEGIIQSVDQNSVTMLVPENIEADEEQRQFGYGYPRRFYRRYYPYRYPLGLLSGLLLYPFLFPPYPAYPGYW
ncbi:hypothetical protein SAMN04487944_10654 [Gracilibacillus ureilyticus]|uniref:Uncharacterized protein n=1 Tax=Gracilibacillus ureilyticus TaxID=531814 RepID=A0A1H9Q6Y3_9BACI|nr:hypothetical protein [Gracilibacillus ureilyticus]SER56231.1 hypothetical protein SAMN04487944_10654 [Gracilibacillus ureilyticus]